MPVFVKGCLHYPHKSIYGHWFVFTSNANIKGNRELVMGAGSAKVCKLTHDGLALELGKKVKMYQKNTFRKEYGVMVSLTHSVVALQTKYDWNDKSPIALVEASLAKFKRLANMNQNSIFHMPIPGMGCGGLVLEDVLEPLLSLPYNVRIYVGKENDREQGSSEARFEPVDNGLAELDMERDSIAFGNDIPYSEVISMIKEMRDGS